MCMISELIQASCCLYTHRFSLSEFYPYNKISSHFSSSAFQCESISIHDIKKPFPWVFSDLLIPITHLLSPSILFLIDMFRHHQFYVYFHSPWHIFPIQVSCCPVWSTRSHFFVIFIIRKCSVLRITTTNLLFHPYHCLLSYTTIISHVRSSFFSELVLFTT